MVFQPLSTSVCISVKQGHLPSQQQNLVQYLEIRKFALLQCRCLIHRPYSDFTNHPNNVLYTEENPRQCTTFHCHVFDSLPSSGTFLNLSGLYWASDCVERPSVQVCLMLNHDEMRGMHSERELQGLTLSPPPRFVSAGPWRLLVHYWWRHYWLWWRLPVSSL